MVYVSSSVHRSILNADPDGYGYEVEPMEYDNFAEWVTDTYGRDVYDAYMSGTLVVGSPHNINGTYDDFNG